MKKYEFWEMRVARNAKDLKIVSLNFDFAELARWRDFAHEIDMAAGAVFPLIS